MGAVIGALIDGRRIGRYSPISPGWVAVLSTHGWRIVETPGGAFRLVIVKFKA